MALSEVSHLILFNMDFSIFLIRSGYIDDYYLLYSIICVSDMCKFFQASLKGERCAINQDGVEGRSLR